MARKIGEDKMKPKELSQASERVSETEIHILPDGAVVILDLDELMLDLALALNPSDYRLKRRKRLLQRKVRRCETKQGR